MAVTQSAAAALNNSALVTALITTVSSISTTMSDLGALNETVTVSSPASLLPPGLRIAVSGVNDSRPGGNFSYLTTSSPTRSSSPVSITSNADSAYLCDGRWLPVNHLYFQLANLFLFLSYLAPNGIYGILYLRVTLCIGCFFFSLWGWVILCAFDTFLWNALFVIINLVHVVIISYSLRPVRFSAELEQVYRELFAPLRVSRVQYKRALDCMKLIRHVRFQEIFAQEKITRVDSLSLVLSGRLVISQHGRALHIVAQHQFLDSPEWFGVSSDEFFQVSATAIEDSRVLIWHRDKLKLSISSDPFLVSVFDHILGRDVVKKLMQVNETLSSHQSSNGQCGGAAATLLPPPGTPLPGPAPSPPLGPALDEPMFSSGCTSESKPLLVALRRPTGEESTSITSLLTRQIAAAVGEGASWRLCRIDEHDQETPV